jgi:hypothetical protein
MRWLEDAENDLRVLKVKRWNLKADNRDEGVHGVTETMSLESRTAEMCVCACVRERGGETPLTASYPSPRANDTRPVDLYLVFSDHA